MAIQKATRKPAEKAAEPHMRWVERTDFLPKRHVRLEEKEVASPMKEAKRMNSLLKRREMRAEKEPESPLK
jgi:hypothetical protein